MKTIPFTIALAATIAMASAQNSSQPDQAKLEQMTARFAPTEIGADVSKFSPNDRKVLARLVQASQIIDGIFLRQAWACNPSMLLDLAGDASPEGRARLHYFLINKGPWSNLDHNEPFVLGAPPKPEGAGFYPPDVTKREIEVWINSLPPKEQENAKGFFTVIRRTAYNNFTAIPYRTEYEGELTRAAAFLTDNYYPSDVAWMELTGAIEPTIGPYEVYEDEWFNYKTGFESFITVQDEGESAKLQKFSGELQDIENHLPIDPKYRNPKIGALSPIVVVNEIFCAGDANHGVQTAAFNLPNDERVTREKGSKRVMLKNVQDAKFAKTLIPISKVVLSPSDQKELSFDAFFTHTVVHELMHGLGPHDVNIGGQKTTVREALKETYSALEEAKADISGLFAIQYMIDKGVLPKSLERPLYTTYLASCFRSIRFGTSEAHGLGTALQFNYLRDHDGFVANPNGTFAVNPDKIKAGVEGLTREIMTLQAEGSYEKAKELTARLGVVRPEVQQALDKLKGVPVDIEPKFTTAEQLVRENP